ncbi:MAG: ribosomal RNA small subunit methyltransferase A [Candidatus Altiarchaeota archaeon]|nr:ribosomal RNA small subunit methyltransferase A [Candidatus Altiarchaeota archaeon]
MAASDRCFMIEDDMLADIVGRANLSPSDVVLEVGAGYGNLTEKIAATNKVSAIEKEMDLFNVLVKKFSADQNVDLILGDALKVEYPIYNKIVSNIPYSISRKLIVRFILEGFEEATLVVQKEFAEKLLSKPDTDEYRMLSVLTQTTCDAEIISAVPAKAFRPQPKVESSLIALKQKLKPKKDYVTFLNLLFSGKNKKLRNILDTPAEYSELRPCEMQANQFLEVYSSI